MLLNSKSTFAQLKHKYVFARFAHWQGSMCAYIPVESNVSVYLANPLVTEPQEL